MIISIFYHGARLNIRLAHTNNYSQSNDQIINNNNKKWQKKKFFHMPRSDDIIRSIDCANTHFEVKKRLHVFEYIIP